MQAIFKSKNATWQEPCSVKVIKNKNHDSVTLYINSDVTNNATELCLTPLETYVLLGSLSLVVASFN